MLGKFKLLIKGINLKKIKKIIFTNSFVMFSLIAFFPVGLFLLWRSKNFRKSVKIITTLIGSCWVFIFMVYVLGSKSLVEDLNETSVNYVKLNTEFNTLKEKNLELRNEYTAYEKKMKPYESMSEADAKKREVDTKTADKVAQKILELPTLESLKFEDKDKISQIENELKKLTKDQKSLVDVSKFSEYQKKIGELEEKAKKDQEKKEQQAAEDAKGYETGITYDQLARTPDKHMLKKVKFYGKVVQVINGDDKTQIRLAVDDNYDTIIYAEYKDSIISSRVLEDDYITIYGKSLGLMDYKSTMGGKITIPMMYVDKIEQ